MFYGGKLLSHVTCESEFLENEFIHLLRINQHSYVVMDSDNKINETKKRIKDEVGENKSWITAGKEIENYLTKNVINAWLQKKNKQPISAELKEKDNINKIVNHVNPEFHYSKDKVVHSKEIVDYIDEEDLNRLDLKNKIDEILKWITEWNK